MIDAFNGGVDLGPCKIIRVRFYQAIVQTGLAGVVGDFERIVLTRIGRKVFHAVDDFFHVGRLFPGAFGHIVIRLSISDGRRQGAQPCLLCLFIQIVFGDDIGKGPVHGKQFRDVLEFGEAAFELVVHPCGVEFPAACDLAEGEAQESKWSMPLACNSSYCM